jgi:hypothetical protein
MVEPVPGPSMNDPEQKASGQAPPSSIPTQQSQYTPMDPAGVWQKFLSMNNTLPVSKEQVEKFIETLNKTIQTLIQHDAARMKDAMEKMKRVQEGEED